MATRSEWAKRVARWEASGLSAAAFAERERLDRKRLVWWRWKLQTTSSQAPGLALDFLPVQVVAPAAPTSSGGAPIEIALSNGRVIRVPAGFDAADLERVLAVASGQGAC